jgi:hypothetical protein
MRSAARWLAALVAALVVGGGAAVAHEPDDDTHWNRELNGHYFIPSLTIADPFLPTEFSLITGAGVAWADGPSFDPRGNPTGRDSYVAGALTHTTSFQVNILRFWAVHLTAAGGLYGGANAKSALALGATVPADIIAGTTVSFVLCRWLRLGGTFDYDWQYSHVIDPLAAVQRSLAVDQADPSTIKQRVTTSQVAPGVTAAFAPHPSLGFVASLQYLWLTRDDGSTTTDVNNLVFGIDGQLDLRPLVHRVPVALLLGYRVQAPLGSSEPLSQDVEGGIYYSGKKALVLGVVARGRWFQIRPGFDTSALIVNAVMRYQWN